MDNLCFGCLIKYQVIYYNLKTNKNCLNVIVYVNFWTRKTLSYIKLFLHYQSSWTHSKISLHRYFINYHYERNTKFSVKFSIHFYSMWLVFEVICVILFVSQLPKQFVFVFFVCLFVFTAINTQTIITRCSTTRPLFYKRDKMGKLILCSMKPLYTVSKSFWDVKWYITF